MEAAGVIVVVGIVVVIVVASIIAGNKAKKKRQEALAALAAGLGWSYDPTSDSSHDEVYSSIAAFKRGHSRSAYNTIAGEREINGSSHRVKMGDYTYKITSHNGKTTTTTTYNFSYLILHLPYPGVPSLFIRPEHFGDKIGAAFGFDDIDFESAEFSRKFLVKSSDKRFAYDVVTPRMMEFLMADRGPTIELDGGVICITAGTRRWKPEEFTARLDWLSTFIDLWPDHVIEDLKSRSA